MVMPENQQADGPHNRTRFHLATADANPGFVTGTLIRTASGDVPVESLSVGDVVVTDAGTHRRVIWMDFCKLECLTYCNPERVMPIRISAHAFGENLPRRDLLLSQHNRLYISVVYKIFIPVCSLLNDASVCQEYVDSVSYYYVALDHRDTLLAENMPVESYDLVKGRNFLSCEDKVFDHDTCLDKMVVQSDGSSPDDAEKIFDLVRSRAILRLQMLGWCLDASFSLARLHLVIDGRRVEPVVSHLRVRFTVPPEAKDVWIVSTTAQPRDVLDDNGDNRNLGICISKLTIETNASIKYDIDLSDPHLRLGFHRRESDHRWTAGRAQLPFALWVGRDDCALAGFVLRVDLLAPALPRWRKSESQQT